jgi:hypothetical protein
VKSVQCVSHTCIGTVPAECTRVVVYTTVRGEEHRTPIFLWLGSKCRKRQTVVSNCIDLVQLLHEGPTHSRDMYLRMDPPGCCHRIDPSVVGSHGRGLVVFTPVMAAHISTPSMS